MLRWQASTRHEDQNNVVEEVDDERDNDDRVLLTRAAFGNTAAETRAPASFVVPLCDELQAQKNVDDRPYIKPVQVHVEQLARLVRPIEYQHEVQYIVSNKHGLSNDRIDVESNGTFTDYPYKKVKWFLYNLCFTYPSLSISLIISSAYYLVPAVKMVISK